MLILNSFKGIKNKSFLNSKAIYSLIVLFTFSNLKINNYYFKNTKII